MEEIVITGIETQEIAITATGIIKTMTVVVVRNMAAAIPGKEKAMANTSIIRIVSMGSMGTIKNLFQGT